MTKHRSYFYCILLLAIYLILKGFWLFAPRIFDTLEMQAQDGMLRLSYALGIAKNISPDIVYVDLDDASLPDLDFHSNDSRLYTQIITTLKNAGATQQIFDILLVAHHKASNLEQSIKDAGNVYLPLIFSHTKQDNTKNIKSENSPEPRLASLPFPHGTEVNISKISLHSSAAGVGHINCTPDSDGVYRRLPLFFQSENNLIPTLSLKAAMDYLKVPLEKLIFKDNKVILKDATFPDGRMIDITIPFNKSGNSRIYFTGPWPHVFAHYSVSTLLEMSKHRSDLMTLRDELEGTLVIVADVTTSGRDFGPVPFSPHSPLSELHAQFLNSILTNTFLSEASPPQILLVECCVLIILFIIALLIRGFRLLLFVLLVSIVILVGDFFLITFFHLLLPIVLPVFLVVLGTITILLVQFINVQQEKKIMQAKLTPYFAPSVMNKILAAPELITSVSKKKLSILFSDIVGFTEWSSTKEAQDIHEALNRYFREMSTIVFSFEGTIDKFMGDGMLAFFGDPAHYDDHAHRAVRAALAMQQKAWELKKEWDQTGGMRIRIRIGIHTGEVVVGNMGSADRMDYTVIGSHVNLAQRLESNCDPDRILISREVFDQLDNAFRTTSNGSILAKGFKNPIDVFYVDRYQPQPSHTI